MGLRLSGTLGTYHLELEVANATQGNAAKGGPLGDYELYFAGEAIARHLRDLRIQVI